MRALTIMQPWAHVIALGLKVTENRRWATHYRGPLAIHAGKSREWLDRESAFDWPEQYGVELPQAGNLVFGAIVAVGELVDCVRVADLPADLVGHAFAEGPVCWIIRNVRRVGPFACAGKQQLWTPEPGILEKLS